MRQETQNYDVVHARLEMVGAGLPLTGLSVSWALLRLHDNQWWDGAAFASGSAVYAAATEILPGVYEGKPSTAALIEPQDGAAEGYIAIVKEPNHMVLEHIQIHVPEAVWLQPVDALVDDTTAGSKLRNVGRLLGVGEGTSSAYRHEATIVSTTPQGHFYSGTAPGPTADTTTAYTGRVAVLRRSSDNRSYSVKLTGVQNDGNNYFGLTLYDGSAIPFDIDITDELFIQAAVGDASAAFSPGDVWDQLQTAHTLAGSFGDQFRRMLALRQENMRIVYTAWNAARVPTNGVIYVYPSKAAMDADSGGTGAGSFGSYQFTATFDGTTLEPQNYTSGKLT